MRSPCGDKKGINKGPWTEQEDKKPDDYVRAHGEGCWRTLPLAAGLRRCGKSCRHRSINYLQPDVKRGNFSKDEEDLIIRLHKLLGNRWTLIAGRLPGRTDNEVKNHWNVHMRKKLVSVGTGEGAEHSYSTVDNGTVVGPEKSVTCMLPDLNLELALPSPSMPEADERREWSEDLKGTTGNETESAPTLALFI